MSAATPRASATHSRGLAAPARPVADGRWPLDFEAPAGHALRFRRQRRDANGARAFERPSDEPRRRPLPSGTAPVVLEASARF